MSLRCFSSWYFDSPIDSTYQNDSFITRDLVLHIDSLYKSIPDKKARAITCHSMDGHGALDLAIMNKEIFGNAGSMSGGVDLLGLTQKYNIAKRIGTIDEIPLEWQNKSVVNMVDNLRKGNLNLIFDCGIDDFFCDINANLHQKLVRLKIDHDYIERPGVHNWDYWRNSIVYQMLFFKRRFSR